MNTPSQAQVRRAIAEAQTIVVKVGSSSLTEPSGHLDPQRLNALVAAIARVRLMGGRVVEVKGDFAAGDAVWVDDEQGNHLAKGLVGFDSEEIPLNISRETFQNNVRIDKIRKHVVKKLLEHLEGRRSATRR